MERVYRLKVLYDRGVEYETDLPIKDISSDSVFLLVEKAFEDKKIFKMRFLQGLVIIDFSKVLQVSIVEKD